MKKQQRRQSEKWDFIDFFVSPSKAISQILLKTEISQFRCYSRGWAVKLISCWRIIDCVFFHPKKKQNDREPWWRTRKQWVSLILSLPVSMTAGAGLSQGQDWHWRVVRWEIKVHHQGNDFWANQENLDPILGVVVFFFKQGNSEWWHRYLFSLQYIFLNLFSFAVAKCCCSSRSKLNKDFYSVPYHVSVLQVVCLE